MMATCSVGTDGVFYEDATNYVALLGLQNEERILLNLDPFVNDATVTFTLFEVGGAIAEPDVWPLPMPYAPGTNGSYRTSVPILENATAGEIWTGEVKAVSGPLERVFSLSIEIAG